MLFFYVRNILKNMQRSLPKCKHCIEDILDHLDNSRIRDQDGTWSSFPTTWKVAIDIKRECKH
jgi:hypothetical protein